MRPVVLLTNAIDPDRAAVLARYAEVRLSPAVDAETLRRAVQDAHAVIVRATLPDDVFRHAPVLRGVVRHGAGVDMIPMREANALGVPVANTPRVNAVSVAEYVVGQMANLAHRLAATMHRLHNGGWTPARTHGSGARELAGKAVGIIGVGAVGGEVA